MTEQNKAKQLIRDFGVTLADKVCNEVLDVIDRCDPMDDLEIDTYKEYWNTIQSLIK